MSIVIEPYGENDAKEAAEIWNEVVEDGNAFPQTEALTPDAANSFFSSQSFTGIARDTENGVVVGLYILHPNNVGRCGHIANASYAVAKCAKGRHIGEALVRDCLSRGKTLGFRILQFNAVVATNVPALALYKKLGFTRLGAIPGGFLMKNGKYEDIIPHYIVL